MWTLIYHTLEIIELLLSQLKIIQHDMNKTKDTWWGYLNCVWHKIKDKTQYFRLRLSSEILRESLKSWKMRELLESVERAEREPEENKVRAKESSFKIWFSKMKIENSLD